MTIRKPPTASHREIQNNSAIGTKFVTNGDRIRNIKTWEISELDAERNYLISSAMEALSQSEWIVQSLNALHSDFRINSVQQICKLIGSPLHTMKDGIVSVYLHGNQIQKQQWVLTFQTTLLSICLFCKKLCLTYNIWEAVWHNLRWDMWLDVFCREEHRGVKARSLTLDTDKQFPILVLMPSNHRAVSSSLQYWCIKT